MNQIPRSSFHRTRAVLVATSLALTLALSVTTTAVAASSGRAAIRAAAAAGDAMRYVKIVSVNTEPGQSQTITSFAGPGLGTQDLHASRTGGFGHMMVEFVNRTLYVKADLGFLEGTFGLSGAAATPVINKWAVVSSGNPSYRNVLSAVTISSSMSFLASAGTVKTGTPTIIAGVKVNVLRVVIARSANSPAGTETLYIARSGPPLPVETRFVGGGYTSTLKYSQWGKRFTLRVPSTTLHVPSAQAA